MSRSLAVVLGLCVWGAQANVVLADALFGERILFPGQRLVSNSGYYGLDMQDDGNLVIYANYQTEKRPIWATNTFLGNVGRAVMQSDGNFVIYSLVLGPVWATGTNGHPNAVLVMQDDGNLVMYDEEAIWASGSNGELLGQSGDRRTQVTAWLPDQDVSGADYDLDRYTTDPVTCAQECADAPQCKAFATVPSVGCYLKNAVPGARPAPGLVAGFIIGR
jgi:hypothetical protein